MSKTIKPRVMCVSHAKDVDGCVAAAIIKLAAKSSFLLTNYGHLNECLRKVKDNYDLVYLCDLGVNETTLEELNRIRGFAELTYIDHHLIDIDLLNKLEDMGVKMVHDLRDCTSALAFNFLRVDLPYEAGLLASYAAVSDRLVNGPVAKELIQKHDRDFVLLEAMLLSYALERADISLKRRIVNQLSKLEHPHQIEEVPILALEQANLMAQLRKSLPSKASKLGNIAYVEVDDSPGAVANLLLDVCDVDIGIGYNTDKKKQVSDLSIRGRGSLEIDLGKAASKLAKRLGGFGGGHAKASGARIPTSQLSEFIHALAKYKNGK